MNYHGEYNAQDNGSPNFSGPADAYYSTEKHPYRPVGPSSQYGEDPWLREDEKWERINRKRRALKVVTVGLSVLVLIVAFSLAITGRNFRWFRVSGVFDASLPDYGGEDSRNPGYPGFSEDYRNYFERYYDEYSVPSGNTIARAATGTGVIMHLEEETGGVLTLQEIYERCIPSIVSITAYVNRESFYWGTGVIMTQDGYIITNAHVLEGTSSVTVDLWDESEFEAYLVGADTLSDLAVLKIRAQGLTPAVFGDSDKLRVGDKVAAIGNPLGEELRGTMTDGIISAINRGIGYNGHKMTLIQTNAALNEGNSGGSLVNMHGQVIGITNMKMSSAFSNIEGLGFAIPTRTIKPIVDALIQDGRVVGRPALGITVGAIPVAAASYYNLPEGVYVSSVSEKSDAYAKGIRPGDIITAVNGRGIKSTDEINEIKNTLSVGDSMTLTIYRDGKSIDVTVMLVDANDVN